jgi:hypothetical protein
MVGRGEKSEDRQWTVTDCATTIEQEPVCVDIIFGRNCPRPDQCQRSGDCPAGTVCVKGADTSPPGVCTFNACLPVC